MTPTPHEDVRQLPDMNLIRSPLLVFGAPRSGTSMLFQALSTHPALWSLYRESQEIIEKQMHPALQRHDTDELAAEDLSSQDAQDLVRSFYDRVGNAEASGAVNSKIPIILRARLNRLLTLGSNGSKPSSIRIVEKNPQNSFRLPFLQRLFPDARFLFISRAPAANIASIYRGWHEPRFKTCALPSGFVIPGYRASSWSFGRPPGWRDMNGRSLIEICAFQWRAYNEACLRDIPQLAQRVLHVRYEDLAEGPRKVLAEIAEWADLDPRPLERFADGLPVVNTWSRPRADKWRSLAPQIEQVLPSVRATAGALGYSSS
jgi:Sulfotransferase family